MKGAVVGLGRAGLLALASTSPRPGQTKVHLWAGGEQLGSVLLPPLRSQCLPRPRFCSQRPPVAKGHSGTGGGQGVSPLAAGAGVLGLGGGVRAWAPLLRSCGVGYALGVGAERWGGGSVWGVCVCICRYVCACACTQSQARRRLWTWCLLPWGQALMPLWAQCSRLCQRRLCAPLCAMRAFPQGKLLSSLLGFRKIFIESVKFGHRIVRNQYKNSLGDHSLRLASAFQLCHPSCVLGIAVMHTVL